MTHRELDIEDFVAVSTSVRAIRSDYILYCVAISNTGTCERNPVLSEKVNIRGTANPAKACRKVGSRMVFISSDQIYNTPHSLEPNHEDNEGKPGSAYGRDKRQAEEAMLIHLPDAVVPGLTWLYDISSRGRITGQDLSQELTDALKERREAEFPVCDYRGIAYVWEVMHHLEEAMGLPGGVYSFGNEDRYSTFDTARLFLKGLAGDDFDSILKYDDERFTSCPRNLTMNTDKIKSHGIRSFSVSKGIRKYCLEHREMSRAWY